MTKPSTTLILILLLLMGVILVLRSKENSESKARIESLENQQRLNLLEVDSLTVGSKNQSEYIQTLEQEIECKREIIELKEKKINHYKYRLNEIKNTNFDDAPDSVIFGILSGINIDS